MVITVDDLRSSFKKGIEKRDRGILPPEGVSSFIDILYGKDEKYNLLDVYRPVNCESSLPCIVNVHGGGWVFGTKEDYALYCMSLAEQGFCVINFSYRLCPECPFPAQIQDVSAVFSWLNDNADKFGIDLNSVYAVGDSAGAHLLCQYCIFSYDKEYSSLFPETISTVVPKKIALSCGIFDFENGSSSKSMNKMLHDAVIGKSDHECFKGIMNILERIKPGFPPALLITSTGDFARNQTPIMEWALSNADVPFVLKVYGDEKEKPGHTFNLDINSDIARICNRELCDFFSE